MAVPSLFSFYRLMHWLVVFEIKIQTLCGHGIEVMLLSWEKLIFTILSVSDDIKQSPPDTTVSMFVQNINFLFVKTVSTSIACKAENKFIFSIFWFVMVMMWWWLCSHVLPPVTQIVTTAAETFHNIQIITLSPTEAQIFPNFGGKSRYLMFY